MYTDPYYKAKEVPGITSYSWHDAIL